MKVKLLFSRSLIHSFSVTRRGVVDSPKIPLPCYDERKITYRNFSPRHVTERAINILVMKFARYSHLSGTTFDYALSNRSTDGDSLDAWNEEFRWNFLSNIPNRDGEALIESLSRNRKNVHSFPVPHPHAYRLTDASRYVRSHHRLSVIHARLAYTLGRRVVRTYDVCWQICKT